MSFASCMLKQLLLVSRFCPKGSEDDRSIWTSSPWFKPHKLHFLSKAINLCFEMRAIYTTVYFQHSSRTARCCGPTYPARKHSVLVVLGSIPTISRSRGMYIHVGGSNPEVELGMYFWPWNICLGKSPHTWISPVVVNIQANLLQVGIESRLWSRRF